MNFEDRVRDALHEYADPIEPEPGSWDRISARFGEPVSTTSASGRRGPSRVTAVFAVAALVLVVVLISTLIVRDSDGNGGDGSRVATSGTAPGLPDRILAVTTEGRPVLLDTGTGEQVAEFDYRGMAAGTPIAVTPDGRTAYVVHGEGNQTCDDHKIVGIPLHDPDGDAKTIEAATSPTVSPDGRYLAYLHCLPGDARADEIVLRNLYNGSERATPAPPMSFFTGLLDFADDSLHVEMNVFDVARNFDGYYSLDLVGGEAAPGTEQRVPDDRGVPSMPLPSPPYVLETDRSRNHTLAVAAQTLYRWSTGEDEPTKLADGITAAGWVPEPSDAEPAPAAGLPKGIAVVRSDGRIADISPLTGEEHSTLMQAAPGAEISATDDGQTLAVASDTTTPGCVNPVSPRLSQRAVVDGAIRAIASGAYSPAVGPQGLVAYGYSCDGNGLGFTRLATGENYRSDALGGIESETDRRLGAVSPLGWSPDGERLVYRVGIVGEDRRRLLVGRLWPAVRQARTEVLEIPGGDQISAATFVDDETLAIAVSREGRTRVDRMPLSLAQQFSRQGFDSSALLQAGDGDFSIPGGISQLVADRSGRHLLVVTDDGRLLRWSRDDAEVTQLTDGVTAATWLPW